MIIAIIKWEQEWDDFDENEKFCSNNNKNKQKVARCNEYRLTDQDIYVYIQIEKFYILQTWTI